MVKKTAKKTIKKTFVNFLRQTHFFFEFSDYFDKYREKIVRIQKFYQFSILNRMMVLSKLWTQECRSILSEDHKSKKNTIKDMSSYIKKLNEGFCEVSLEDCILNIKL